MVKLFFAGFLIACVIVMGAFTYFYVKYERLVDRRMAGGVFSNAAKIYARPQTVSVGEKLDADGGRGRSCAAPATAKSGKSPTRPSDTTRSYS